MQATATADKLHKINIFLNKYINYFLLKNLINSLAVADPMAPPIGKQPINQPCVELSVAQLPKNYLYYAFPTAEIILRQYP
jgi:hypothetical protein